MSTRIRLRRADYTNWHADNPTLDYGEVGLVFDTIDSVNTFVGFKIGDGSTAFDDLLMHRVPTSDEQDGRGLGADGDGVESGGESVTTWDQIALLAREQTFSTTQTFGDQIISTYSAPENAIQVNTDMFTVKGNDGDTAIAGTLAVTGATTVTGAVTANGGVTVTGGKVTVTDGTGAVVVGSGSDGTVHIDNDTDGVVLNVNTDRFTVQGQDGNTVIAGTLGVTGALTATTFADATWQALVGKLTADGGLVSNEGSGDHYGDQTGSDIAIGGIRSFGHRDWATLREDVTLRNVGLHDAANGTTFLCLVWMFVRSGDGVAVDGPDATIVKIHTVVDGADEDEVVTTRTEMKHGSPSWGNSPSPTGVMGFVLRLT